MPLTRIAVELFNVLSFHGERERDDIVTGHHIGLIQVQGEASYWFAVEVYVSEHALQLLWRLLPELDHRQRSSVIGVHHLCGFFCLPS